MLSPAGLKTLSTVGTILWEENEPTISLAMCSSHYHEIFLQYLKILEAENDNATSKFKEKYLQYIN